VAAAIVAAAFPLAAGAHVGGGALILLLPTHLYVAGGALVVVASFVLVALVPARLFARLESTGIRVEVGRLPGHGALSTTLGRLFALVESYPDLKANQNMMQLSEELSSTENRIAFARQAFNDAVMTYNTGRELFPAVLFAGIFGFQPAQFMELEDKKERESPKVSF